MVRLAAETEDIHQKATAVQQQAGEMEAQLARLSGGITDLHNTWQGTAAQAFQELYEKWNTQARTMRETLESIGRALNAVGTDYERLEIEIASHLH